MPSGEPPPEEQVRLAVALCSESMRADSLVVIRSPPALRPQTSEHRPVLVTVIVTKTPRNGLDVVRRVETARCRRLRPAQVCATGRDGLRRRSACS